MTKRVDGVACEEAQQAVTLRIDKRIYSKAAVLRACYWFTKDLKFQIDDKDEHLVVRVALNVSIPTLDNPRIKPIDEWLSEFFDTLLDSQLRVEIQAETAGVRELIIAKAFAESGVLEDPPPGTFEDPLGAAETKPGHLIQIANKPNQ